jgi:DNA-binding transcriptional regulator YiaG
MSKEYRDEIALVCHDMMKSAQSVGAISNTEMRELEKDCFIEKSEASHESDHSLVLEQITV